MYTTGRANYDKLRQPTSALSRENRDLTCSATSPKSLRAWPGRDVRDVLAGIEQDLFDALRTLQERVTCAAIEPTMWPLKEMRMSKLSEMTLYEIFNHAIQREREAQELYRHAATLAGENTPLRRMFLALAQDEQRHEEQLVEQYPEFKQLLPRSDKP